MLSTVQMPPGYPVATVALDGAGAKNAAWLAASILALGDPDLTGRIAAARQGFIKDVETAAAKLGKG
jgi:5-(carboxyamino)imidazole ribonucleotide mutase